MKENRKRIALGAVLAPILVLVAGFACRDGLIRHYVKKNHTELEQYALSLLAEEKREDRFGPWRVSCWSEEGTVEFHTGGYGLAPSSVYKGFYYSVHDRHHIAVVGSFPTAEEGDTATWSLGGDNGGESTRFAKRWFWFEAWF